MPFERVESDRFMVEWKKLERINSPFLMSAAKSAEAALWLIGGRNYPQALVALDNAIELALKGQLAKIDPDLIEQSRPWTQAELEKVIGEWNRQARKSSTLLEKELDT